MVISDSTFIRDVLFFLKNDLSTNITDPILAGRNAKSEFVLTSYPKKYVQYPIITLKVLTFNAKSAGMQTNAQDVVIIVEARCWARNEKEKDELATAIYERLRTIQFTTSTGSVANELHDFTLLSAVEVDEEGDNQPKSRVLQVQYKFYNV